MTPSKGRICRSAINIAIPSICDAIICIRKCYGCFAKSKPAGSSPDALRRNGISAVLGVAFGVGGSSLVSRSYTKNLFENGLMAGKGDPK